MSATPSTQMVVAKRVLSRSVAFLRSLLRRPGPGRRARRRKSMWKRRVTPPCYHLNRRVSAEPSSRQNERESGR